MKDFSPVASEGLVALPPVASEHSLDLSVHSTGPIMVPPRRDTAAATPIYDRGFSDGQLDIQEPPAIPSRLPAAPADASVERAQIVSPAHPEGGLGTQSLGSLSLGNAMIEGAETLAVRKAAVTEVAAVKGAARQPDSVGKTPETDEPNDGEESGKLARPEQGDNQVDVVDDTVEVYPGMPHIAMATVEGLDSVLPEDRSFVVAWPAQFIEINNKFDGSRTGPNHPLGQKSLATTPENPAVLFDASAASCSPLLVFDEAGSALHYHESPLGGQRSLREIETRYLPELTRWVGKGRISFAMGGSNLYPSGEIDDLVNSPVDEAVAAVDERVRRVFPDADFYPLISRRCPSRYGHPAIPADATTVRGFIFIPRYIARDDRNHVLAIGDNDHTTELRAFLRTRGVL